MGSSMMHLAVTAELLRSRTLPEPDRLRLGSVLPDYCTGNGHLKLSLTAHKRTYDLTRFRSLSGARLRTDGLCLGYYLHLVQDLAFRAFVYGEHHFDSSLPENVQRLHRDYSLCNAPLAEKYALSPPEIPTDLRGEPVCAIGEFDLAELREAMREYFTATPPEETPFFFTRKMAEDYIAKAAALCQSELDALAAGAPLLDERQAAWGT